MSTDEETEEIEPDDEDQRVSIPPSVLGPADVVVHAVGFARRICGAVVLSLGDLQYAVAAHANAIRAERAVSEFRTQLSALPTTGALR